MIPIMVSSLVVIFAVVELLILPFIAQLFPRSTADGSGRVDGAIGQDRRRGGGERRITEALILAKAAAQGIKYQPGWILGTAATVKVFIDIFIGVWAFVLAWIWTRHIDVRKGDTAKVGEIWERFPKFVIGYVVTFLIILVVALTASARGGWRKSRRRWARPIPSAAFSSC